ncbi:MAG: TSUP family transporter [Clostridia bacterium]|nr:TSUP family transporter [Clostridia bacterium]
MIESKDIKKIKNKWLILIIVGALAGFLNGMFGGGGGMIVVPMLIHFLKFEEKHAHATAIFIILPLSILSAILYTTYGNFDLFSTIYVTIGVIGGGIIGALLLKKLSSKYLTWIFSLIMLIAGVKLLLF